MRMVVKEFQNWKSIDFKLTTIRSVLSIVTTENLHLEQLDVKMCFSMVIWRRTSI